MTARGGKGHVQQTLEGSVRKGQKCGEEETTTADLTVGSEQYTGTLEIVSKSVCEQSRF